MAREPFVADAAFLLEAVEAGRFEGFMSATTVTDVHYLVGRQTKSAGVAITAVTRLLTLMEVCPVDREVLKQAIALGLEAIVTRGDMSGFVGSPTSVLSPGELKDLLG